MKYTVITACLNGARYLERTLHSVLTQDYGNYEIIVQDGGSTDTTPLILERYARRINARSEPDSGIYDAWNRGLERANGDWVIFLGADDFLIGGDVFSRCAPILGSLPPHVDSAYGALARGVDGRPKLRIRSSLTSIYSGFFQGWGLPFAATFTRISTLRRYGFDPSFTIAGDFDFTARTLAPGNIARIPHFVSFMETGGVSDSDAHDERLLEERSRILRDHIIPKAPLIAESCLAYLDESRTAEDLRTNRE